MALELNEIISRLERLLVEDLGSTFEELKKLLIPRDDAWDSVILLEARHHEIKIQILRGTISNEDSNLGTNKIRLDLLNLIQDLKKSDLQGYEPTEEATQYEGHLLYKIPLTMQHNEIAKCLVRIAIEKMEIIKNIEITNEVRQEGLEKVSDVMQVELVDPSMNEAFKINAINEPEQLILKEGYTEWRFDVKPLKSGVYPLLLKVAVLIMVNRKERKREITLEKEINVTTVATELEGELKFVQAGVQLNMNSNSLASVAGTLAVKEMSDSGTKMSGEGGPPILAPVPSSVNTVESTKPVRKSRSNNLRKLTSAMSVILLLAVGAFLFRNDYSTKKNIGNPDPGGDPVAVVPPDKPNKGNGEEPDPITTNPGRIELAPPEDIFGAEGEGGQYFAMIDAPLQYVTRTESVVVQEASTQVKVVPAIYRTETERVLVEGSNPPRYKTETKRVVVKPEKRIETVVPAKYELRERRIISNQGQKMKLQVLGGEALTTEKLKTIQRTLGTKGYDVGKAGDVQSVVNKKFKSALIQYQKDNDLPIGNLDFKTLRRLGIEI